MKTQTFNYLKENGKAPEARQVLTFNESETYIEGLDLDKLSKDEQTDLLQAVQAFDAKLKPFMSKAWRRFKTDKIVK